MHGWRSAQWQRKVREEGIKERREWDDGMWYGRISKVPFRERKTGLSLACLGDVFPAPALITQAPVSHLTLLESQVSTYGLGQCSPWWWISDLASMTSSTGKLQWTWQVWELFGSGISTVRVRYGTDTVKYPVPHSGFAHSYKTSTIPVLRGIGRCQALYQDLRRNKLDFLVGYLVETLRLLC